MREITRLDDLDVAAGGIGPVAEVRTAHVDHVGVGEVERIGGSARVVSLQVLARARHAADGGDRRLLLSRLQVPDCLLNTRHAGIERGDVEILQLLALLGLGEVLVGGCELARELVQGRLVAALRRGRSHERVLGASQLL